MSDSASPPSSHPGASQGTRLNDIYEIDRPIASGGMGDVFEGHTIHTGDRVAIKILRAEFAENEAALALFRKEASALHNLQHDAIVRYYVCSFDPILRRPYLAMEFVEGQSLSQLLQQGPLTFEAARTLLQRLAAGLHAAHARGIIHRDVAPDNVIIPDGDVGRAKIIDFGIARSTNLGDGTVIGSGFAGKYNYVSPEQLGLFGGDVKAKSDIYSLGLVLFEAVTGKPLDMGGSQAQIVEKRRMLPPLAGVDLRIKPLLERMLRPDPEDRPDSMMVVANWPIASSVPPSWSGDAARTIVRAGQAIGQTGQAVAGTVPRAWAKIPSIKIPSIKFPKVALAQVPWPKIPAVKIPARSAYAAIGVMLLIGAGSAYYFLSPDMPTNVPPPPPLQAEVVPPPLPRPPSAPTVTTPPDAPPAAPLSPAAPTPVPPSPPAGSRVDQITGFINKYDGGSCFMMAPISVGDKAARIEGYGSSLEPFQAFDRAFSQAYGFEAEIGVRLVTAPQCPVVSLLAKTRDQSASAPRLEINETNVRSGQTLSGTIEGHGDRHVDLLLVSDDGSVHNLSSLVRTGGERKTFNLRFQLANSTASQPQFLVAIASGKPVNALQLRDPSTSADLFPALQVEAARSGETLGVAARYFKLQ